MAELEIRCMKCKTNKLINAKIIETNTKKGIKHRAVGVCPDCGTNLSKFTSAQVEGAKADAPQPPSKQEQTKRIINYDPAIPIVQKSELPKKEKKKIRLWG